MTDLKTLKDIEFFEGVPEIDNSDIIEEKLKQEAIKWVKYFGKTHEDFIITGGMDCTTFIKNFFNLTEEDLQ